MIMNMRRIGAVFTATITLMGAAAPGQSTAFTYQGQLKDGGVPAIGPHDLRFRLFDAASGGVPIGATQCVNNLSVNHGLFTATLDFGQQFTSPAARFIEIDVRRDAGLDCANVVGFVTLSPRQLITATPMATHAKSAFSLDSPDGSPTNAVSLDNSGNVGIGLLVPGHRLDVSAGFLGDGIGLRGTVANDPGYHLYEGNTSRGTLGLALQNGIWSTSAAPGDIVLRSSTTDKLLLQNGFLAAALAINGNNVGIGTTTPASKLEVRGDIRLGTSGQLRATAGEENLRIIRGSISHSGAIASGSGFTVSPNGDGQYTINFATPFTGRPTVTATLEGVATELSIEVQSISNSSATVAIYIIIASIRNERENAFSFIAVGSR